MPSLLQTSALALLMLSCGLMPGIACAPAFRDGEFVNINEEAAVIVWDAKTHTEHFVRQAAFDTNAKDFGFLVPTPTPPTLAEASGKAFAAADELTQPKTQLEVLTGYIFTSLFAHHYYPSSSEPASTQSADVEVLSTQRVAGYDATVLKADNVAALAAWLKKHGYATSPAASAWLAPYTARHWIITAFKISKGDPQSPQVSSAVVRMSFVTPRPYFPYREPSDQRLSSRRYEPRTLRIYLLSQGRMEGTKGLTGAANSWPAQTLWANPLSSWPIRRGDLAGDLALTEKQIPDGLWMTAFEDRSSPRPGTDDVYFQPSPSQSSIAPPPEVEVQDKRISIPVEPLLLVPAAALYGAVRLARRKKTA